MIHKLWTCWDTFDIYKEMKQFFTRCQKLTIEKKKKTHLFAHMKSSGQILVIAVWIREYI